MTFRSFSRFVRWYRWPLLLAPTLAVAVVFLQPGNPQVERGVSAAVATLAAMGIVWFGAVASDRTERIFSRWRRIHHKRLRAMPLRGWTK